MEVFYLKKRYIEEMIAHAIKEAPNECCGILAGSNGQVGKLYPLRNTEKSQFRYNIDSSEVFRIIKDWEIIAIYHSHTNTVAYPSPTDVELAFWSDSLYIIISLSEDKPIIRAFKIVDKKISEVEVIQV